ncbi:hypothetical protein O7635_33375 [Asanoa sp. WMMD1127]|uniref:hypothetical protein n=1 Tax=Asanoa sp. WMMD1127 TaxID=3016107 RepID=UPI0024175319|nr:hypothetical protein [Asanoa sp. WMMD1127]MDG4826768.1 hypothetical protein [Asanoa sp. WMMD1127]
MYDDHDFDVPPGVSARFTNPDADAGLLAAALGQFRGDTLILESALDEVIPHSVIEKYLQFAPTAQHRVTADATHALTEASWREKFRSSIVEWFSQQL